MAGIAKPGLVSNRLHAIACCPQHRTRRIDANLSNILRWRDLEQLLESTIELADRQMYQAGQALTVIFSA